MSTPAAPLRCAYLGQYHLEQFERDLQGLLRAGVGKLYLPLTEEDLLLRRPDLARISERAREHGIEPWFIPWGVGGVFAGPRGSGFVARHLDARQIDSAGESLPAACPNHPRFAHFMEIWLQAAAECGAAGIMLDEPMWLRHAALPEYRGMDTSHLWTCRCEHCQRRFRSLRGGAMPEELDDAVRDFRARTLGAFLRELGDSAWRHGMASSLRISRYGALPTWETVARQPWCAELSLSAFWPTVQPTAREELDFGPSDELEGTEDARVQEFERQMEAGRSLLERLQALSQARVFFWLRCFQIAQADEPLIAQSVEKLRALGAAEFGIWSFDGSASLGALACERPRECWEKTLATLGN